MHGIRSIQMLREIEKRQSIRKFTKQSVSADILRNLIEAARLAPSGNNTQPWHFIIITSQESKMRIAQVNHNQRWLAEAPVLIACVGDMSSRVKDYCEVDENSPQEELKQIIRDTAIATEHIVLEAEYLGLSTCWTAWFVQADIRPVLGIPSDKYVVGVLALGYSDKIPSSSRKKSLDELIHHEKW